MTEQQKFEATLSCEEDWGHRSFKKRKDGRYEKWSVQLAWDAWQARASQDRSAELLEALERYVQQDATHGMTDNNLYRTARAAISKARGK